MAKKRQSRAHVSSKGLRLLRKVKAAILANPRAYRQDQWHCGTAMCIAGHICFMSGQVVGAEKRNITGLFGDVEKAWVPVLADGTVVSMANWERIAVNEIAPIGAGYIACENLFSHAAAWPEPFASEFRRARTYAARADVAARRIEHYITEGE